MRSIERFLGLFTRVRPGEGATALLLTAAIFAVMTAYSLVKPVREALILAGGGAEVKSYAAAGQALLLVALVPLYAWLASRYERRRLVTVVTLFFTACLVSFFFLARAGAPVGVPFYLWLGIFNLMVVAQFWSFSNDLYLPEEGERLFPLVAFGASAGAVLGSLFSSFLIRSIGVAWMLPIAGGVLLASLGLMRLVDARESRRRAARPAAGAAGPALARGDAFRLVIGNPYLRLIAILILLLNVVNTTGEYILGRTVSRSAAELVAAGRSGGLDERQFIGDFYARFFTGVNLASLVMQLFVVSRILRFIGVRGALLVLPSIAFGAYGLLAFHPALAAIRWGKTAENATDYSLQNTLRAVLFLPTTREDKYKAKQAIDTFFVRTGDVLSAGLVWLGVNLFAFEARHFAMVNLVFVCGWVLLAVAIGRRHAALAARMPGP